MSAWQKGRASQLAVVGSANIDYFYEVERFAVPNETIHARALTIDVGGKGLNQAVSAARSGAGVRFLGAVGCDANAALIRRCLIEAGVDETDLVALADQPCGSAAITVADSGANMITVAAGANAGLSVQHVENWRETIANACVLLLQCETPHLTLQHALSVARESGVTTILNPAPATSAAIALVGMADIVTPNESETEILTGISPDTEEDCRAAAEQLRLMGSRVVIITRGADGIFLVDEEGELSLSAFNVAACDTTGAGDVFNGVLAASLAAGMGIRPSVRRGMMAAAVAVCRKGAQRSAPDRDEIDAFELQHPGETLTSVAVV